MELTKPKILVHVFNGDHLAKVVLLHLPGNNTAHNIFDQLRRFPQFFKTFVGPHEPVRVGDKLFNVLAPMISLKRSSE